MIFNYVDYGNASGLVFADGSMQGDFVRTNGDGYIYYQTRSTGTPMDLEYQNFYTGYSDIEGDYITCTIDPDYSLYDWSIGAFSIAFDASDYDTLKLTVHSATPRRGGARTQEPLCQIVAFYDSTDVNSGITLQSGEMEIDLSSYSGNMYLRFIGDLEISKIELT